MAAHVSAAGIRGGKQRTAAMRPAQQSNALWLGPRLQRDPRQRCQHISAAVVLINRSFTGFLRAQLNCTARTQAVGKHGGVALSHQQICHGLVPGIKLAASRIKVSIQTIAAMQRNDCAARCSTCRCSWRMKHQRLKRGAVQAVEVDQLLCTRRADGANAHHQPKTGFLQSILVHKLTYRPINTGASSYKIDSNHTCSLLNGYLNTGLLHVKQRHVYLRMILHKNLERSSA